MALERQDIEKRDFPVGRRGYDPDAVDRHLRWVADEVEALRAELEAAASRKGDSLAAAASDQVGAIVEAAVAESSADADTEGARLIALNMALNGTSREETDRYLAANFDLPDRGALLDEVYARVG